LKKLTEVSKSFASDEIKKVGDRKNQKCSHDDQPMKKTKAEKFELEIAEITAENSLNWKHSKPLHRH